MAILFLITAACQTFATLSIPQAVTKFVAENNSRGARNVAASAFFQAARASAVLCVPVVIGIYIGASFLASHLLGDITFTRLFQVLALDVFFYAGVLPLLTSVLLGLHMYRVTASVGIVCGLLRQFLIIVLILLLKNLVGLVIGWLLSDATTVVVYSVYVLRALGKPRFDFPLVSILRFSLPLNLSNIASYAQNWFDRALLTLFVPLATLGVYSATLTAFGVLTGIDVAMTNMLYPAFSSIDKSDGKRIADAARLGTRYASFVLIPLTLGLFATARPALTFFVGESYIGGTLPLMMLTGVSAATLIGTAALPPVLLAIEETRLSAAITSISVAISIVAGYVLLPYWGTVGAATARALGMILTATLAIVVLKRKVPLQLDLKATGKYLIAGTVMAAAAVAAQLIMYSSVMLPLYVVIGGAVYLTVLRLLKAVGPADMDLLRGFLGTRLSKLADFISWIILPSGEK